MIAAPRRPARVVALMLAVAGASASTSCIDPVHSDAVAALGSETAGVGRGPRHRPGQPCLTCHGGMGPASPEFSVAGTVYTARDGAAPLGGVTVAVTDARNETRLLVSNDAGNFYIAAANWAPVTPLSVQLQYGGKTKVMKSHIGGTGACAVCHYGADNQPTHMPPVFMSDK